PPRAARESRHARSDRKARSRDFRRAQESRPRAPRPRRRAPRRAHPRFRLRRMQVRETDWTRLSWWRERPWRQGPRMIWTVREFDLSDARRLRLIMLAGTPLAVSRSIAQLARRKASILPLLGPCPS